MADRIRRIHRTVASSAAVAVDSAPVYVGGSRFAVQIHDPQGAGAGAGLSEVQVSEDQALWTIATDTDAGSTPITLWGRDRIDARERPSWARLHVAVDAGGPRQFTTIFSIVDE